MIPSPLLCQETECLVDQKCWPHQRLEKSEDPTPERGCLLDPEDRRSDKTDAVHRT